TAGITNRVEIEGDPVGVVGLSGPGAGGAATSSAVLGDLIAIARGLGSTWAGRPAAGEPSIDAGDSLAAPRPWFAFVPRASADAVSRAIPGSTAVDHAHGVAVRTGTIDLVRVRAALAPLLPDGTDATLYPVD